MRMGAAWSAHAAGRRRRDAPPPGRLTPRGVGSGLLDRGDVEGELDLVADQHAAAFESGVVRQAPVAAADGGGAVEADPDVAVGVGDLAVERQVDGDRAADALDGEVTVHAVRLVVD